MFQTRGLFASSIFNAYHGTDGLTFFVGRTKKAFGTIPIIFFHDAGEVAPQDMLLEARYQDEFRTMIDVDGYTVAAGDLNGPNTYANDNSITSVNELLTYLNGQWGSRKDKVLLYGYGMGALLALNWAWRNQTKPLGIVLAAPVVALSNYYSDNAGLQASIDAAYGNHTNFTNGLPTHDPLQNIAKLAPFGNRIRIFYASDDALVHADDVQTFAALTGADLQPAVTGGHTALYNMSLDKSTSWLIQKAVDRRTYEVDWKYNDWSDLRENFVTHEGATWSFANVDGTGGRRGRTSVVGTQVGNERRIYLPASGNVKMADSESYSEIWSGDGAFTGQQGVIHRVTFTGSPPVSGQGFMIWQNIIFTVPWLFHAAVWKWMPGVTTAFNFVEVGGLDSLGLRNFSGGQILGCSRTSNIATYVCDFSKIPSPGDLVFIENIPDSSFNINGNVLSVDTDLNTMTLSNPGTDTLTGGPGRFANNHYIFPIALRTQVYGEAPSTGRLKVWPLGTSEPSWDDPLWAATWSWSVNDAGVYGEPAFLVAHIGDIGLNPQFVDQGRFYVREL